MVVNFLSDRDDDDKLVLVIHIIEDPKVSDT